MIGRECPLDALGGQLALRENFGRIVDQNVDSLAALTNLAGKRSYLCLQRDVGEQELGCWPGRHLPHYCARLRAALRVAADHQHAGAHTGEFARRHEADAAVGAGDENDFLTHASNL
jgi:hypothetical protein